MVENIIELRDIFKYYEEFIVLDNFNLDIKKNEFLILFGLSGCGKIIILKIIVGFEYVDDGKVLFEGKEINNLLLYER